MLKALNGDTPKQKRSSVGQMERKAFLMLHDTRPGGNEGRKD